jgi:hypothetical protein
MLHRSERQQGLGSMAAGVNPEARRSALSLYTVNNCLSVHHGTKHDSAYCDLANQWEVHMPLKARNLVLTKSQAACLVALRHRKGRKAGIAILAKLDLLKTAAALRVLMRLGLARQDRTQAWHTTARAKTCRFETVTDRPRRNSGVAGPGARRLLEVLDRPMRGREIAEKLGVTHQRVHQLAIRLHAQGRRDNYVN